MILVWARLKSSTNFYMNEISSQIVVKQRRLLIILWYKLCSTSLLKESWCSLKVVLIGVWASLEFFISNFLTNSFTYFAWERNIPSFIYFTWNTRKNFNSTTKLILNSFYIVAAKSWARSSFVEPKTMSLTYTWVTTTSPLYLEMNNILLSPPLKKILFRRKVVRCLMSA